MTKIAVDPTITAELKRAASLRRTNRPARQNSNQPLWMPKGSVRALITIAAVLGYAAVVGYAMTTDKTTLIPDSLNAIVLSVVAFYFGTRSAGKEIENEVDIEGDFSGEMDRVSGSKNLAKHR